MSDNENENRDTVADVVAMVRRAAQYYEGEAEKSEGLLRESFELSAANYRTIANLVEAAWKRERAKVEADALEAGGIVEAARTAEESSAVGNAAAMREALKQALYFLRRHHMGAVYAPDGETLIFCEDVAKIVDGALSAPARNCDLYDDAKIAWQVWIEDKDNWDEFGSPKFELCEWLFAPAATERKGEADGSR